MQYYEKGNNIGYPLCMYSLGISYVLGLGNVLTIDEEKGNKLLEQAYPKIMQLINAEEINNIERTYAKFVTGAYHYFGLGGIEKNYKKALLKNKRGQEFWRKIVKEVSNGAYREQLIRNNSRYAFYFEN